jgi:hypothetical protein
MKEDSGNSKEDNRLIFITFSIIIVITIGVLMVAFGVFDQP